MNDINFTSIITQENYQLVLEAILPLKNEEIYTTYVSKVYELLNEKEVVSFSNYLEKKLPQFDYSTFLFSAIEKLWHIKIDLKLFKQELYKLDNIDASLKIIENLPIQENEKKELFEYYLDYKAYHIKQNHFKTVLKNYYQYDLKIKNDSFWTNNKVQEELLKEMVISPKMQKDFKNLALYRQASIISDFCHYEDKENNLQKLLNLGLFDDVKDRIYPSYMSQFNQNFAKIYNYYNISFRQVMKEKVYYLSDFLYAEKFNHTYNIGNKHKNEFLEAVLDFTKDKEKPFDEKEFKNYISYIKNSSLEILMQYWNYFVHFIEFGLEHSSKAQAKIDLTYYITEKFNFKDKEQKHFNNILIFLEKEKLEELIQSENEAKNNRLKI